jgi:asparagine synthase (glutamine-hydrolysing)
MCGIFAIFSSSLDPQALRKTLIACSSELRHRGPDWSGYVVVEADPDAGVPLAHGIAHERLAIMDPESGSQPLVSSDGKVVVAANGEVYNYREVYDSLVRPYAPATGSDCEVILPLWEEMGPSRDLPNALRGMFSVIVYDQRTDTYFVFRDHVGKTPLYVGWGDDGSTWFASEMKSIVGRCSKFRNFPPGHCYASRGPRAGEFVRWYRPDWAPEMTPGREPPRGKFQEVSVFLPLRVRDGTDPSAAGAGRNEAYGDGTSGDERSSPPRRSSDGVRPLAMFRLLWGGMAPPFFSDRWTDAFDRSPSLPPPPPPTPNLST